MVITRLITKNSRAVFYALTVVMGIFLALSELDEGRADSFRNIGIIVSFVFLIEIYSGWHFRKGIMNQTRLYHSEDYSPTVQFIHHFFLPVGLYFSILLFGYYNHQMHLRMFILIVSFLSLSILFANLRAYYLHRMKMLQQTNYIYDITKFLIFFCVAQAAFVYNETAHQPYIIIGILTMLSIILINLMLIRYQRLELRGLIATIIVSLLVGLATLITVTSNVSNALQISFISTLSFYIASALIHHQMDRSLNFSIILEYLVVLLISVGTLIGFN